MRAFNEEVKDVEGVKYFSWGATYDPGLIDTWKWPHTVILEKEGPNDGLVSVESSKWVECSPLFGMTGSGTDFLVDKGTYLGTLQDVNHLDLVGWINTARYKWAEMFGKEIKFRPATFYLGVADFLAGEVEGQPKEGEGEGEGTWSASSSPKSSTSIDRRHGEGNDLVEATRTDQEESGSSKAHRGSSPESRLLLQEDIMSRQDSRKL
jgi:triacylglycerol lipase